MKARCIRIRRVTRGLLGVLGMIIVCRAVETQATPVNLGAAGPEYWSVLSLGGPTTVCIGTNNVYTVGNGGIAGSIDQGGITGTLLLNSAGTLLQGLHSVSLSGGVQQNPQTDALLALARNNAMSASSAASALATTPGFAYPNSINMNGDRVLYGSAGVNVLNLTDLVLTGGSLTLNAPKGGSFVINVADHFKLSGGADILLAGGLTPCDVLFNILGAGSGTLAERRVEVGEGAGVINGIILAPQRSVTVNDGVVYGQIIGGFGRRDEIQILSRSRVFTPVPEASTIIAGTVLAGLIGLGHAATALRRNQQRSKASKEGPHNVPG